MSLDSYTTRFYYPDGIGENNSTGVVGVYRTIKTMRSGNEYPYYESTVHVKKGKVKTRAASVRKHGEATAFIKMCEWRRKKLREIYGDRFQEEKFHRSMIRYLQSINNSAVNYISIFRENIKTGYSYGNLKRIEFKTETRGKIKHYWLKLHGLKNSAGKTKTIHLGREYIE